MSSCVQHSFQDFTWSSSPSMLTVAKKQCKFSAKEFGFVFTCTFSAGMELLSMSSLQPSTHRCISAICFCLRNQLFVSGNIVVILKHFQRIYQVPIGSIKVTWSWANLRHHGSEVEIFVVACQLYTYSGIRGEMVENHVHFVCLNF